MTTRTKIFLSYSHKDRKLVEEFKTVLAPVIRKNIVDVWDDSRIVTGSEWKVEIQKALSVAKIGILFVSDNFLASEFIAENELPPLLSAAESGGATIFWICLSHCLYQHAELGKFQAAYDVATPLDTLTKRNRKAAWVQICDRLLAILGNPR